MPVSARSVFFMASLTPMLALAAESKWLFAGESRGVAFQLRITDACKDGSKVAVRLKGAFDEDVRVSFRLNDSDWRKTFTRELKAGAREVTVAFVPEESQVCHPYVDQVEVAAVSEAVAAPEAVPAPESVSGPGSVAESGSEAADPAPAPSTAPRSAPLEAPGTPANETAGARYEDLP